MRSLFCLLLCMSMSSWAETVTIGFGKDRAPYVISKFDKGITVDLFRAALKPYGYDIKTYYFRAGDTEKLLDYRVQAISIAKLDNDKFFVSQPYLQYHDRVIFKKSDKLHIKSVADLSRYRVAAWPGAHKYIGKEYAKHFTHRVNQKNDDSYLEPTSQLAQNQMFWRNHADVLIIDEYMFKWYRHALRKTDDTSEEVEILNILPESTMTRAAFVDEKVRDAFDKGIQRLRKSGEYQRIINHYIQHPSLVDAESPSVSINPVDLN